MPIPSFSSTTPPATFTMSGKIKQTIYNAKDYGAVGNGSTDDTANLQLALNAANTGGGGLVYVPYGASAVYNLTAPLVIHSNTILQLHPAVTMSEVNGSFCNMLQNASYTANRSTSDAAIMSGSTTLTSATANFTNADIGSSVRITGAGPGGQAGGGVAFLVTTIASVTSTTATLNLAASTTVTNGAMSIYRRDTNIEVFGGTWNRNTNPEQGQNQASNSLQFGHLDGIYLHDMSVLSYTGGGNHSGGNFAIDIGDVTNYKVHRIYYNNSRDGCHINGPALGGSILDQYGTTLDDMVAFTSADVGGYNWTNGLINGCEVSNVTGVMAQTLLKITGGTSIPLNNIHTKGVHGTCYQSVVRITNDNIGDTTCAGIVVEDVDCDPGATWRQFEITCGAGKDITLRNITSTTTNTALLPVYVFTNGGGSAVTVESLTIDGVHIYNGGVSHVVEVSGTIDVLNVRDVNISSSITALVAIVWVGGTGTNIKTINIDGVKAILTNATQGAAVLYHNQGASGIFARLNNIYVNTNGRLFQTAVTGSTDIVQCENCTLDGAWDLAYLVGPADLSFNDVYINNTQSHLVGVQGASATCTVRGYGINYGSSNVGFSLVSTPPIPRVINPDFKVDITTITTNTGDMAYNTNSGQVSGIGRVTYNGSAWEPLALPQDIYTTSSPTFKKLLITTGSNANAGTGTLSGGTVVISTTAVTSSSLIFLTDTTNSLTNLGTLTVSSVSAGVSFTVKSSNALDTSTFNWFIIN